MKKKVYFRADAGQSIGYGHFIRSLALADMLKDNFDCTFFTQTPSEYQKQEAEKVCPLVALPADDTKFGLFLEHLNGDEIVVLDNYFYTSEYQLRIKEKGCRLVCIDDISNNFLYADIIINHGFADPQKIICSDHCQICIGPQYALLRKDFLRDIHSLNKANYCVVCFGGVDDLDLTGKVVRNNPHIKFHAIIGEHYRFKDKLSKEPNVTILTGLTSKQMASELRTAKMVVCSSSTICYEALACRCVVYSGYYVDNQKQLYKGLKENNYIIPLGNLKRSALRIREKEEYQLQTLSVRGVKENLVRIFSSPFTIKMAAMKDASLLYRWANDPIVRLNAYSTKKIRWNNHLHWLKVKLENKSCVIFIIFYNARPLGQIRFDKVTYNTVEIDYSIDKDFRGMHLATRMLSDTISAYHAISPNVTHYYAEVKRGNDASSKAFIRMGFERHVLNEIADSYLYTIIQ